MGPLGAGWYPERPGRDQALTPVDAGGPATGWIVRCPRLISRPATPTRDARLGLFLHPTVAVDASKRRAIEAKESCLWRLAAEEAADVLAGVARITVVADRENGICELFARRPIGVQLLTRAAHDRSLADGGWLFASMDAWPERHREMIVLPV